MYRPGATVDDGKVIVMLLLSSISINCLMVCLCMNDVNVRVYRQCYRMLWFIVETLQVESGALLVAMIMKSAHCYIQIIRLNEDNHLKWLSNCPQWTFLECAQKGRRTVVRAVQSVLWFL